MCGRWTAEMIVRGDCECAREMGMVVRDDYDG